MPTITFIEHHGAVHTVEARIGQSIMQAAVENGVPGILADCGGSLACGSCRGFLEGCGMARFPPPGAEELALLEAAAHPQANARLTCQLVVQADMDGLRLRIPESQYG